MSFQPPYLWLGPKGALWLEITLDDSREAFLALADRLCRDYGGTVTERVLEGSADKEYWYLDLSGSSLLLMRKTGLGTALGGKAPGDRECLERIAGAFGARRVGWRWRVARVMRW